MTDEVYLKNLVHQNLYRYSTVLAMTRKAAKVATKCLNNN